MLSLFSIYEIVVVNLFWVLYLIPGFALFIFLKEKFGKGRKDEQGYSAKTFLYSFFLTTFMILPFSVLPYLFAYNLSVVAVYFIALILVALIYLKKGHILSGRIQL